MLPQKSAVVVPQAPADGSLKRSKVPQEPKISVATFEINRESNGLKAYELALTEAIKQVHEELDGSADLILCFVSAVGAKRLHELEEKQKARAKLTKDETDDLEYLKSHVPTPEVVLKCASTLVGDVPFAAGTTNDFQAGKNKIAGSMEQECFDGYNKASLVVWAIRDPDGAFAVGGSTGADKQGGLDAANEAKKALHADLKKTYSDEKLLVWLMATPGNEEEVLNGVREAVPRSRLLGASSADEDPSDVNDHSWQCIGGPQGRSWGRRAGVGELQGWRGGRSDASVGRVYVCVLPWL